LIDIIGADNVNTLLENLGLENTRLLRKMQAKNIDPDLQENLSTPRELSKLLLMILNHKGLDQEVCERTIEVLKLYKVGVIRDSLPDNIIVADKSGWMGAVECDTAIVYAAEPYIVTVMAKHIPDWDLKNQETKEAMKQVVSEIHSYYHDVFTTSTHGRRIK
jgi:beta-lactamase class A